MAKFCNSGVRRREAPAWPSRAVQINGVDLILQLRFRHTRSNPRQDLYRQLLPCVLREYRHINRHRFQNRTQH